MSTKIIVEKPPSKLPCYKCGVITDIIWYIYGKDIGECESCFEDRINENQKER